MNGTLKVEDHMKKWYEAEGYAFTEAEVRYNKWNGQYYIHARMRKTEGKKEGGKLRGRKPATEGGKKRDG